MSQRYVEGFVEAEGYRIHYLEWGKAGEAMILLHGTGCTCSAHDLEALGKHLGARALKKLNYTRQTCVCYLSLRRGGMTNGGQ